MNHAVTVHVSASTLENLTSGNIVGEISLAGNGWVYPSKGWSDFPVIILGWWFVAIQRVGSRVGASALCKFMDGPYGFRVTSIDQKRWLIECLAENGKGVAQSHELDAEAFLDQLQQAAREVVRACVKMRIESVDLEHLQSLIRLDEK